jgi:hypothetical protein
METMTRLSTMLVVLVAMLSACGDEPIPSPPTATVPITVTLTSSARIARSLAVSLEVGDGTASAFTQWVNPQESITRDSVQAPADARVTFRVRDTETGVTSFMAFDVGGEPWVCTASASDDGIATVSARCSTSMGEQP